MSIFALSAGGLSRLDEGNSGVFWVMAMIKRDVCERTPSSICIIQYGIYGTWTSVAILLYIVLI